MMGSRFFLMRRGARGMPLPRAARGVGQAFSYSVTQGIGRECTGDCAPEGTEP